MNEIILAEKRKKRFSGQLNLMEFWTSHCGICDEKMSHHKKFTNYIVNEPFVIENDFNLDNVLSSRNMRRYPGVQLYKQCNLHNYLLYETVSPFYQGLLSPNSYLEINEVLYYDDIEVIVRRANSVIRFNDKDIRFDHLNVQDFFSKYSEKDFIEYINSIILLS